MFGIKTKILRLYRNHFVHSLAHEDKVLDLLQTFQADAFGHQCNYATRDMGYGWVHYGLIRQIKPKKVLCIGSRHGFIPAVLAQACKDNRIGVVDFVDAGYGFDEEENAWTGVGYWKTDEGKNIFSSFGLQDFIKLHIQKTDEFESQLFRTTKYDYIYIDGDHSLEGVVTDFRLFYPYLRTGGFMAFHDISITESKPEGEYGVWKLWQILRKRFAVLEFPFSGSGLGVMQK